MMPLVSIILPFLNAGPYLAEAIASVEAQSEADWELLLIDDGSTDASPAIAARAAAADPRIRLITRPADNPGGAAAARNLGLREARGAFIAFLDADDLYEPGKLASQLAPFREHPEIMIVYGPTRWWHPGAEHRDWTERMRPLARRVHKAPDLLNRVLLMQRGHVPCTCGVLIRREALEMVGGFDEAFALYEDQTLWAKLLLRFPAYVTDLVCARYRQHGASATARSEQSGAYDRLRPHQARIAFLNWVRDHARASGLADPSVERALRLAFAPYGERTALSSATRWTIACARSSAVWAGCPAVFVSSGPLDGGQCASLSSPVIMCSAMSAIWRCSMSRPSGWRGFGPARPSRCSRTSRDR
jgi:GT2 family glycosyltransferase